MSAASFKLPKTSLQLSLGLKVFIQHKNRNNFCIYLQKIDFAVCPLHINRFRYLVPIALEDLFQQSEALKVLCSILECNCIPSKKRDSLPNRLVNEKGIIFQTHRYLLQEAMSFLTTTKMKGLR